MDLERASFGPSTCICRPLGSKSKNSQIRSFDWLLESRGRCSNLYNVLNSGGWKAFTGIPKGLFCTSMACHSVSCLRQQIVGCSMFCWQCESLILNAQRQGFYLVMLA